MNTITSTIVCKQCGRESQVPPSASHKTFCSTLCRNKWHGERRAEALKLLQEKETQK